jgi:deoxyribonuclease-4
MLPNGRRLGAHLPLGDGMVRAADRAADIGASALQVFTDNPTAWRRRPRLPAELPAFRDRLAAHGIAPLAVHAPYLVNLAGPDPDFHERSVAVLANELHVAGAYGAAIVNVHVGSHRGTGTRAGALRLADGLRQVQAQLDGEAANVTLVLENGAGSGFGLGSTIEELTLIDRAAGEAGVDRSRVGFCLDTAHLWGAGYPIDTAGGVDDVLERFDRALGLERLRLVHLNDSRDECGSRSDRHEHIGAGRIGTAGLRRILDHPGLAHVAYVLETPGMDEGWDAVNMRRVQDIAAGRPLDDLPPGAFQTRSGRGRSAPAEDDGHADAVGGRSAPAEDDPGMADGRAVTGHGDAG